MMQNRIYLDYSATTPLDPRVLEEMKPYLQSHFGNPSSQHFMGREAKMALDTARDQIAESLHAEYGEICFTSGGTEADNQAIIGVMLEAKKNRNHLIVSAIEHHAVLHTALWLREFGFELTILPVDGDGRVNPDDLRNALTPRTALVSIMHANNEIGTVQEIAQLAKIAHENGSLFHTDIVQSFAHLPIHLGGNSAKSGLGCDLASISSHKIYGPKGVGALYIRKGVKLHALIHGGSQERERRAGTENVAGIVGFGKACELLSAERELESLRLAELRDRFIEYLSATIPDITLHGPRMHRLPNNIHISVKGVSGATLLMLLDQSGIAASSGSACSSGSIEPSHVLIALGISKEEASSGIRFSLGKETTWRDLEIVTETLREHVARLRA